MSLVEQMIDDPNSPLKMEDAEELQKLSPQILQRLAIGLQPQLVTNSDREKELRSDLQNCQKDVMDLLVAEQEMRTELEQLGVYEPSVLAQIVPVMNSAPLSPESLSEEAVVKYVQNAQTVTGNVLREALQARELGRAKAITTIVSNSKVFTEEELRRKHTPELLKLADFVQQSCTTRETPVLNWAGAGLADMSINQSTTACPGSPLDLPTTLQ